MKTLEQHREDIDQIHQELHALLRRRRDSAVAIWQIKQQQGLPFHHADREKQILEAFLAFEESSASASEPDPEFRELMESQMNSLLRNFEKYLRSKFPS